MDSVMNKLSDWSSLTIVNAKGGKTAEIDIEGVIGFEPWWNDDKKTTTKELMKAELKKIANLDVDEITVRINSYGGDVNHAVSMYDLLVESNAKVITDVHGHTASAATIIAQAGDERRMSSTALYLTHQAQTVAVGTADDMEATKKTLDTVNAQIANIYAMRSGKTAEEMREVMDRNNGLGEWITADEAKELGLIDTIVEPVAAAASVSVPDADKLAIWNIPDLPTNKTKEKELSMFDRFKQMFNFSDEQSEVLDALESIENMEAKFAARLDALNAEKDELIKANADLKEQVANFEAAAKIADELKAEVDVLKAENQDQAEKLEKMTANVKPPVQEDPKPVNAANIVEQINNIMAEKDCSYEEAYKAFFAENKEIHNELVISKRK